jgi:cytoskeleton protein RodZ
VDERETLGKYLKNQRESKKISLREVANNTRVREHLLKAIEEDQYHLLPPATYVKGFLLAYARYLRLDPNEVLLRYERVLKGEPDTPPPIEPPKTKQKIPPAEPPKPKQKIPPTEPPKPKEKIPPTEPPKPKEKIPPTEPPKPKQEIPPTQPSKPKQKVLWNTKQTWVVGGVVVASLIVSYLFFPYPSKLPIKPIPEKPFPEKPIIEEKLPITPSPPVVATTPVPGEKPVVEEKQPLAPSLPVPATTSVPEKKTFSLQLKAVEETWVSLQVDDQSEKEMTFKAGEGISVQASNRIRIIIGNAGGLDLILNGKPLDKFGKSGEVLTLLFTSQGVEVKRSEKPNSP